VPEPDLIPTDPDVDLRVRADRRELSPHARPVLAAVSAGGAVGALCRYSLQVAFPHPVDGFAWATLAVNAFGCLLIGVLMALITHVWTGRPLLRPFLGVGVLGGFTTFSTYAVDIHQAVTAGAARTALAYLMATLVAALVAVWTGSTLTGWAVTRKTRRTRGTGRTREGSR
jgi:CrcB protein